MEEDMELLYFILIILKYLKVYLKLKTQQLSLLAVCEDIISRRESVPYCNLNCLTELTRNILELNEDVIRAHLRIGVSAFKKIISILPEKRSGWDMHFELMVFLFWLASGTSYRVTGSAFNITRYSVRTIVHRKLEEFEFLFSKFIKCPGIEDLQAIGNGFNRRANCNIFNNAVGAIDGTHIRIKCPTELHDQYINRKLYYSIQMQAVCDSSGRFLSVFIGYPGSVHGQRILRNSPLYKNAVFPPSGFYLLGDSGYVCTLTPIAIMTPIKENRIRNARERRFNKLHSKARNVVECAFGSLKTRWRSIFNKELELSITRCIKTTAACCVMHNICLSEELLDETNIEPVNEINGPLEEHYADLEDDSRDAELFREELLRDV